MDDKLCCPFCGSPRAQRLEARYSVRIIERPEAGGWRERKCPVYRCLECERELEEIEAEDI